MHSLSKVHCVSDIKCGGFWEDEFLKGTGGCSIMGKASF